MLTKKNRTTDKRRRPRIGPNPNTFGARLQAGMYGTGFPRMMHFTHVYAQSLILTSTTGAEFTQQFSTNGLYDPDITGTGVQPAYFDQLTPIYDHYTVFKSRFKYTFLTDTDANVVAYIDDDTSGAGTISAALQQPSSKFAVVPALRVDPTTVSLDWDAKQYFGGNIFDNDDLQGSASANPVEQSYFTVIFKAQNSSSTCILRGIVQVEYWVVWDELKTVTVS